MTFSNRSEQTNKNSTNEPTSIVQSKPVFSIFIQYADQSGEREALNVTHDLDYHIYWETNMMSLRTNADGLAKLSRHDSILSIELSKDYKSLPQSTTFSNDRNAPAVPVSSASKLKQGQWGYSAIQASAAVRAGFTGKGIKIAVLDTGVSEKSALNISGGVSTVDGVSSYEDDNGHGTFVAGIIGAKSKAYKGIAPDASIYAVKVMDKDGNGSTESLAKGLDWAIRQRMDIINLSLSFPQNSPAIDALLEKAAAKGITVIVAAGNSGNSDGSGNTLAFPAKSPETITVAAVDSDLKRAAFSGTGDEVELSAPGVGVVSSSLSGKYKLSDGTSAAAPFVSGMVAVLKQAYPNLSADQIRTSLQRGAIDLGPRGRDPQYGYGMVSFERLIGKNSVIPNTTYADAQSASSGTTSASGSGSQKASAESGTFR
ncbi:S8 family peptidase [Saccharibacillus alkalitolerans]|uniref:S8 family peptidase n=1 Tax=Saccharibacillus alkalitolerans TaxID=2705290 RepID=A0ABX0F3Q5_9BACL|nr:S8 family peptidase [Saccharibacillus alkalitolerans]NGZ75571.1 S8 family peptidase [Saccharibacillus alkalitolerans]